MFCVWEFQGLSGLSNNQILFISFQNTEQVGVAAVPYSEASVSNLGRSTNFLSYIFLSLA
jgi:hypothetical protein